MKKEKNHSKEYEALAPHKAIWVFYQLSQVWEWNYIMQILCETWKEIVERIE